MLTFDGLCKVALLAHECIQLSRNPNMKCLLKLFFDCEQERAGV